MNKRRWLDADWSPGPPDLPVPARPGTTDASEDGDSMRATALLPSLCCPGGRRRLVAMLEKSEIRFLPVGARRVAYEIRGDGPPLVAPAWWASHLELDLQSAGFRRFWEGVADGYALIRYDRLGVGMSDRTVRDSDLTLE